MHKILILEDEVVLAELVQELLRLEGYEVRALKEFDNILEEIREFNPDGIILDVHLNEVNGIDLLEDIRKDSQNSELYIVAISGMDHSYSAKQKGANDFLLKPYMPDELVELLRKQIKE